jgi:membrane dipeptidase
MATWGPSAALPLPDPSICLVRHCVHVEGADIIDADLLELEHLYELGLRSLGPVWSRPNIFAHGVPFAWPRSPDIGPGLTPAGRD